MGWEVTSEGQKLLPAVLKVFQYFNSSVTILVQSSRRSKQPLMSEVLLSRI